jgi:hypothetical protein
VARFVGWFTLAGVIAVVVAGTATTILGRRAGEREAIVDLRAKTLARAQLRVQPAMTNGLLTGNITSVQRVDKAVRHYVLDKSVPRVKIWNREGTIVYCDDARLIGAQHALRSDELRVLGSNVVRSKVSDPSDPDNRFERSLGKLLEVDVHIRAPNGQPFLLAVYYRYRAVTTAGTHVWNRFAPIALGALLALTIGLLVVGSLLARRFRRKRQVAPVAEPEPAPVAEPEPAPVAEPDPATALVDALSYLVARTSGGGVATTLDTDNVHNSIPPAVAEMFFRATEEALRSQPAHETATPVRVRVSDRDHVATLDVIDAGGGQLDLRALTDIVADVDGRLVVDSGDNGARRVHVEVQLK